MDNKKVHEQWLVEAAAQIIEKAPEIIILDARVIDFESFQEMTEWLSEKFPETTFMCIPGGKVETLSRAEAYATLYALTEQDKLEGRMPPMRPRPTGLTEGDVTI